MLSVLILTFNEAQNLPACLASVAWSDDVVVVDSGSTDGTAELARSRGARVVQRPFTNFADQRNFGLTQGGLRHEWVLHLDADERVTPELRDELLRAVKVNDKDAFRLPSKMMFDGRWLKYSGLYPWYQVRVGRRDALRFVQAGHGQREQLAPERIGTLSSPLFHYSFSKGLHDWIEKHNRYSTDEALYFGEVLAGKTLDVAGIFSLTDGIRRKRALKHLFAYLPFRPTLRFLYMYCVRLGFLDGRAGWTYCRMLSIYEYFIVLKLRERRRRKQGLSL